MWPIFKKRRQNLFLKKLEIEMWNFFFLGTFCLLGRFVPWDVLSLGTFCPWDLMSEDVLSWDVLSLGTFCLGMFYLCTQYTSRFCRILKNHIRGAFTAHYTL